VKRSGMPEVASMLVSDWASMTDYEKNLFNKIDPANL